MKVQDYKVIGSRGILVELDKFPESQDEIYIPKFENYESDSGKVHSKVKDEMFGSTGVVLQISEKAAELLADEKIDLQIGDKVAVSPSTMNTNSWFIIDRTKPVVEKFEGYIVLHPSSIQAILINND